MRRGVKSIDGGHQSAGHTVPVPVGCVTELGSRRRDISSVDEEDIDNYMFQGWLPVGEALTFTSNMRV